MEKINIGIIGATGSIGKNTLSIISQFKERFNITFLSANSNYKLLAKYANEFEVRNILIIDESKYIDLKRECNKLNITNTKIFTGKKSLIEFIKQTKQTIVIANNGITALEYIVQSILSNQTIMLANKEALVSAGDIINNYLINSKSNIIPIDSEHNAIYQMLYQNNNINSVAEMILTASGGPFYNYSDNELENISKKEAIKHPNWSMGEFISVNSATLVNKALEIIEAHYLFHVDSEKIKALYHPESLIHGMIKYHDGTINMIAYKPNMQVAISYALFLNNRVCLPNLQMTCCSLNNITIQEIKPSKVKPINLAREALKVKGNSLCIFNVANEEAVNAFLLGKIKFLRIMNVIEYCLDKMSYNIMNSISEVYEQEKLTRYLANQYIKSLS